MTENVESLAAALNVDDQIAELLVANSLTTVLAIAGTPIDTIAAIPGFDMTVAQEICNRASAWLKQHPEAVKHCKEQSDSNDDAGNTVIQDIEGEVITPPADSSPKKKGRPVSGNKKVPVSLRLTKEILSRLQATGKGWQTRAGEGLNALLDEGRI